MTFPYKLTTNSKARSKRNRAPSFVLLGSSQRCMLSPDNHDGIIINAPHRQHTAYRTQRGVPAASNTQRVHRTVQNRQATSRSIQRITCHNVQHIEYIAYRTGASCTACTLAAPGRYLASSHGMPRMHASFRWKPRYAVYDERRRSAALR